MTTGTFGTKHLLKISLTIGFAVLFVKVVRTQRYSTSSALEALGMPVLTHRIDEVTLVE